jgi:putative ABC transport system permease protein
MRLFRGWRPALRMARREALRARGRSILVLVMIGLPVLGIVALDTLARTSDVSTVEGLSRQIGSADALVTDGMSAGPVDQTPDMSSAGSEETAGGELLNPTAGTIRSVLGPDTRVLERVTGRVAVRTEVGLARPTAVGVDLQDPMTRGLFDLRTGRYPRGTGEVVVSERLAGRGFPVGSTLTLADGSALKVVGTVESTTTRDLDLLVGQAAALGLRRAAGSDGTQTDWLVSRPAGVDWAGVRALNAEGMFALSRAVIENPPPASQVTMETYGGGVGSAEAAVLALVVAMALLEVVLLAGPAFAVGARRQQRALALMAASGAEPPHLRRVVVASGVVLGTTAAVLGSVLGVGVAWLARPVVQQFSSTVLGPFEVAPRDIAAIAACGLLSALLAALLPALVAARSDVVAILAGRRGETKTAIWSPVLGALMLTAGIAGAAYGALQPSGELYITVSAIFAVLGMVLLTPLVLGLLGHVARLLPLPARFAVRDAARHRSRTAPAVAAVAATVAGVVALGIGGTSDAAENRALYTPAAPAGAGIVLASGADSDSWTAFTSAVQHELPGARTTTVRGIDESQGAQYRYMLATDSAPSDVGPGELEGSSTAYAGQLGSSTLVGPAVLRGLGLSGADLARARQALARGDVVVFDERSGPRQVELTVIAERYPADGGEVQEVGSWEYRGIIVRVPGSMQPARAVVPATVAREARMAVVTTSLLVEGAAIDQAAEERIDEVVAGLDQNATLYVERGFQDDSTRIMLLLLGSIGGVLVLGGTLTATFLALSDARPDFATMGAVGAEPRTRRAVAAAYAGTIGLVGAVLGAAVGFVPGIAVTFPLTGSSWAGPGATTTEGTPLPGHFLDVPWLLVLGLVVVLPLVTATVVGLTSRSRLPMVSRLS